jgi:hypothetical protein
VHLRVRGTHAEVLAWHADVEWIGCMRVAGVHQERPQVPVMCTIQPISQCWMNDLKKSGLTRVTVLCSRPAEDASNVDVPVGTSTLRACNSLGLDKSMLKS